MRRLRIAAAPLLLLLAASCAPRPPASPAARAAETEASASTEEGLASWYGGDDGFDGKPTASGETYDPSRLTAAHRDLPLGTVLDVTNVGTGKTVRVRINDRGPFVKGRIIDLSREAARRIDVIGPGVAPVRLMVVSPGAEAPLSSSTGQWSVQVGSFGEPQRAQRHADRVRAAGFAVYFEPYAGLTRVKVGPVDSREAAEAKLRGLEDAGFEGIVVPR
ncbi:MAG TPA: septal ring lytic transglycosylase RlpA family protein [Thermoanaerobaculia bacterium]|jgi:rare lipoprotein A